MGAVLNILKAPRSVLTVIGIGTLVFAFAVWLPNIRLLIIVATGSAPLADKIAFPLTLLLSIKTNFTTLSAVFTIVIAILSGINIALIAELVRTRQVFIGGATAGVTGIIAGAFGIGCAACGTLVVTALTGTILGASAFALLPFGGGEFGVLGVLLLGYSTYLLSKQIIKRTCEISI